MLTLPQISALILAALSYLLAGALALTREQRGRVQKRARAGVAVGSLLTLALFLWHSLQPGGNWQPLGDNVAALLGMATLIGVFLLYIQFRHPIASLELFLVPVILVLLVLAGFFGQLLPQSYLPTGWSIVHRVTTFLGAVAFAIAAATGAMYIRADRALRSKRLDAASPGASLERLSSLNYSAVTWGFALLTIGCLTGFVWMRHINTPSHPGAEWLAHGKVHLALAAWALYAVVLHTPITPRLRGRRNAWLSIAGCVLILLSAVAVFVLSAEGR